jgi:hypothetical protein
MLAAIAWMYFTFAGIVGWGFVGGGPPLPRVFLAVCLCLGFHG